MLASEYGWAKEDILDRVYLDEVLYLQKIIRDRKIGDIKIRLNIAQNPYTKNPRELFDSLTNLEEKKLTKPEFSKVEFENLKAALDKNPRFRVK